MNTLSIWDNQISYEFGVLKELLIVLLLDIHAELETNEKNPV